MRPPERAPSLRHAVALGLLQGPTELLPISSSGHTTLIPWLAGWNYSKLDGDMRKAFEVALHTGAGAALALDMRGELTDRARHATPRQAAALMLSLVPAAIVGTTLREPIERHLGGPASISAGLIVGAVAMAAADARAPAHTRGVEQVGLGDGLMVGLAQATALMPGVSRNGATLAAARARGFSRPASQAISWAAAFPVIVGATLLKGRGLAGRGTNPGESSALVAAVLVSFASTLVSARLLRRTRREGTPLIAFALYRCMLAALVIRRLVGGRR